MAIIPEERILRRRRPPSQRGPVVGKRLASFMDLKVGDHVVHEDHGIGRLTGFETSSQLGQCLHVSRLEMTEPCGSQSCRRFRW